MSPWPALSPQERTVRRLCDWQRVLGDHFAAWSLHLKHVENPLGHRFFDDFGAGEREYEVSSDHEGHVAIPVDVEDVGSPRSLNITEAEFRVVDLGEVLRAIAAALACSGGVDAVASGVHRLGTRTLGGKRVVFLAAPAGLRADTERSLLGPAPTADVAMLLVPDLSRVLPRDVLDFRAMNVAVTALPPAPPWDVDLSSLAEDAKFGASMTDPSTFYGKRFPVFVDLEQQSIWLEGRRLNVRADSRPYRLFAYLAERPGIHVPRKTLANLVIESEGESLEARIVSDVKHELVKAIRATLAGSPAGCRLNPETLVVKEMSRVKLDIDPALVKVFRRISDA